MLETKAINDAIQTRGPNQQKSWKFPKFHLLSHAFDSISEKGVTSNYNMKPVRDGARSSAAGVGEHWDRPYA